MKKEAPELEKATQKMEPVHAGDLEKALERIYRQYGDDFEAFFRDAKESILKHQSPANDKREAYLM
jgi:hypothetical protein